MKNNLYLITTFNGKSPTLVWAKNSDSAVEHYKTSVVEGSTKCILVASGINTLDVIEKFLHDERIRSVQGSIEKVTHLRLG